MPNMLFLKYKRHPNFGFPLILEFTPRVGTFSTLGFGPVSWARQSGQCLFCGLLSGGHGGLGGRPDNYRQLRVEGVV